MPTQHEALEIARRLHVLAGGADVVRKAAARELSRLEPVDATELMHHLIALARAGTEPVRGILSAFVSALSFEAANIRYAPVLKRLSELMEMEEVSALFAAGDPRQQMNPEAAAKQDAVKFTESLGHLKSKARLSR